MTINVISIVNIVIITTILFNLSRSPRSDQTKTCPGLTWLRSSARWGKPWRQCVLALASPTSPLRRPVSTGDNALDNICWTNSRKVFYAFKETFLFSFPAEMLLVQCWEKLSAMENRCGLKSLRWPFQLQSEHSNRNDTLVSKSGVRKSYWFSLQIPGAVCLTCEEWGPESGLVTAAMKLKRRPLQVNHGDDDGDDDYVTSAMKLTSRPLQINLHIIFHSGFFRNIFATFVSYLALEICLDVFVQERYQEDINRMYGPWAQTRWRKTEENCFDFLDKALVSNWWKCVTAAQVPVNKCVQCRNCFKFTFNVGRQLFQTNFRPTFNMNNWKSWGNSGPRFQAGGSPGFEPSDQIQKDFSHCFHRLLCMVNHASHHNFLHFF